LNIVDFFAVQELGAPKSPRGRQQSKERRKHLRGCWLSFSSASFCRLFPAFVARKVLDGIFCPSICNCISVCAIFGVGRGWPKYATPFPIFPPEMLKLPKNKAPLNFFYANLLCSFFLFATLIFVYFRLQATPTKQKKINGGRKSSGNRNPQKEKMAAKQLQVEGKFLDTENFLGLCFCSLFLVFSFCFRSL